MYEIKMTRSLWEQMMPYWSDWCTKQDFPDITTGNFHIFYAQFMTDRFDCEAIVTYDGKCNDISEISLQFKDEDEMTLFQMKV